MPTQLDNTWLPPETRTDWDGTKEYWAFDYGSWEYNRLRIGEKVFNGKEFDRVTWGYWWYEYSVNIRTLIEHYEIWAKQNKDELQKITDGKNTITIDDLLWYLRYEKKTVIGEILGENRAHYNRPFIQLATKPHTTEDIEHISHVLMKAIRKSINDLDIKK